MEAKVIYSIVESDCKIWTISSSQGKLLYSKYHGSNFQGFNILLDLMPRDVNCLIKYNCHLKEILFPTDYILFISFIDILQYLISTIIVH